MAKQKTVNSSLLQYVGAAIKKRRVSLSLSQEMLAELSDLHTTTISDIERGKSNLTLTSLELIARALKCSEADFLPDGRDAGEMEALELAGLVAALHGNLTTSDKKKFTSVVKGVIKAFS